MYLLLVYHNKKSTETHDKPCCGQNCRHHAWSNIEMGKLWNETHEMSFPDNIWIPIHATPNFQMQPVSVSTLNMQNTYPLLPP